MIENIEVIAPKRLNLTIKKKTHRHATACKCMRLTQCRHLNGNFIFWRKKKNGEKKYTFYCCHADGAVCVRRGSSCRISLHCNLLFRRNEEYFFSDPTLNRWLRVKDVHANTLRTQNIQKEREREKNEQRCIYFQPLPSVSPTVWENDAMKFPTYHCLPITVVASNQWNSRTSHAHSHFRDTSSFGLQVLPP